MANLRTIQFLRSSSVYTGLTAAKEALSASTTKTKYSDGAPLLARYVENAEDTEVKTLLGIAHVGVGGEPGKTGITFFETANEVAARLAALKKELDDTQEAVGLDENGAKIKSNGYKFISGASTVEDEIKALNNVIDGLDYAGITPSDAAVITNVTEADGLVSASTQNVGNLKLTDYVEGTESGHVAATDSINAGIAKLQNQIDAANDKVNALDATTVSGDSKVVIDVTQEDGQITATAANLSGVKLEGLSATADTKIASTDTLGEALAHLQGQIDSMNKAASVVPGQVVTTVTEADGKVSETKANVKDLQLGGYVKDANATGDVASTDTINAAISKIENKIGANTVTNADGSIVVTTTGATTDVKVNIKSGEHVIAKDGNNGIYTNIAISAVTGTELEGLGTNVKEAYKLVGTDSAKLGEYIKIYKDSSISKIYLGYPTDTVDADTGVITSGTSGEAQSLNYVYHKEDGTYEMVKVDVSKFLAESEFASGVTADTNGVVHGVVDQLSEKVIIGYGTGEAGADETADVLTVGADGFKASNIQAAINAKIGTLDKTDAEVAGQYVKTVTETDGIINVARANVSDAVLNGYAKGSDATAVAATDTVNQAVSKLENQIDKAKAAATTKVVEGTDEGNNLTISSATSASDGSTTYTINLTDVASHSALTAEITARKAVDGQDGQEYAKNTSSTYISGATSLNDADVKLDAALKAEADRAKSAETAIDGVIGSVKAAEGEGRTYTKSNPSYATGTTVLADVQLLDAAIAAASAKTVTAVEMTGGTAAIAAANDGTKKITIDVDGSTVKATGYDASGVTADQAIAATDSINVALAKLYATSKAHHAVSSSTVSVSEAANGTTFEVRVDNSTAHSAADDTYASDNQNMIQIKNGGLYASSCIDCGTF